MDVVRINMSHSSHSEAEQTVSYVCDLNRKLRHPIPILVDTNGPEIRTGERSEPVNLVQGATVILGGRDHSVQNGESTYINVVYPDLVKSVRVGDTVRLDNGLINVKVLQRTSGELVCRQRLGE